MSNNPFPIPFLEPRRDSYAGRNFLSPIKDFDSGKIDLAHDGINCLIDFDSSRESDQSFPGLTKFDSIRPQVM